MIRTLITFVALAMAGLFGYFYFTDTTGRGAGDKMADAAKHTGDAAVDQGVAAMVKMRLSMSVGVTMTRFLHVWADNGKVLIYGLFPEGMNAELLRTAARQVPGVSEVDVRVVGRPTYLDSAPTAPTPANPRPG